jgi:hypothetical protein
MPDVAKIIRNYFMSCFIDVNPEDSDIMNEE